MTIQNLTDLSRKKTNSVVKDKTLSYLGPINHQFSDALLSIGDTFFRDNLKQKNTNRLKVIFSSFVEMVQNVADYNEIAFQNCTSQNLVIAEVREKEVVLKTKNRIRVEDLENVKSIFSNLVALNDLELKEAHKHAILNGKSLGLLMIRKLKDSSFLYEIDEKKNTETWLNLQLKINYEITSN